MRADTSISTILSTHYAFMYNYTQGMVEGIVSGERNRISSEDANPDIKFTIMRGGHVSRRSVSSKFP